MHSTGIQKIFFKNILKIKNHSFDEINDELKVFKAEEKALKSQHKMFLIDEVDEIKANCLFGKTFVHYNFILLPYLSCQTIKIEISECILITFRGPNPEIKFFYIKSAIIFTCQQKGKFKKNEVVHRRLKKYHIKKFLSFYASAVSLYLVRF